jgi:hypothetical protein
MQKRPLHHYRRAGVRRRRLIVMVAETIAEVGELPTEVSIVTGIGVAVAGLRRRPLPFRSLDWA